MFFADCTSLINVLYTDKFEYLMKFAEIDLIYSEINDLIISLQNDYQRPFTIDSKILKKVFIDKSEYQ